MVIAKNNKNFLDSEIMRSLEKVALKKGLIKADDLEKTASVKEEKNKLELTKDLHNNLISLAVGLKDKGYEKEYNNLIDRIFIHKQAEAHLYRVFDEDGEDLLDFAHPEGDAQVMPGEYGMVETLSSAQKKTIDKVNKVPTGKYAAIDPVVSMSLSFGEAMGPLLEMDSGDIADIVIKPLVRAVKQDFKGTLSDLHKIADLFDRLMKADASDWANHIKNEKAKFSNYDMNQALGIVAENAWVRAHVRYQNQMRNGTFASEIQKVIKKGQNTDLTVSIIINELINLLYSNGVGELIWFGKDPAFYDEDANIIIAQEILKRINSLFKSYLKDGIAVSATWALFKSTMIDKMMDGSWFQTRLVGGNILDVGRLYFAISQDMFKNKHKYIEFLKPNKSPTKPQYHIKNDFVKELKDLSDLLDKLESIRSKHDITKENEENAYKIQNILSKIESSIESASSFTDLVERLKLSGSEHDGWDNIKDIANLKSLINKAINDARAWIPYLEKKAGLKKESDLLPAPPSSKSQSPAGSAYPAPGQSQSYSSVKEIQTELGKIGDLLKQKGALDSFVTTLKETGSRQNPTVPDGIWGGKTIAAIEALNKHIVSSPKLKDVNSIPKTPSAGTVKALKSLSDILAKTKGESKEIGSYGKIPLERKDLLSAWHIYKWSIENNLLEYQQDETGREILDLKKFLTLVNNIRSNAQEQIKTTEDKEDRKKKIVFAQILGNVWNDIYNASVNAGKNRNMSSFPEVIWADELKSSKTVTPGMTGVSLKSLINKTINDAKEWIPHLEKKVTPDGRLADGVQLSFIGGGGGMIPAGYPAKFAAPVSAVLDLSDEQYWDMPEKFRMDYYTWRRASAKSLASSYFARRGGDNLPMDTLEQHSLMYFMDFLRRLGGQISTVFNTWQEDLRDNPTLREKLVNPSEKSMLKWMELIQNKHKDAQEALRASSQRR